ncbi:hypothetical protein L249_4724 [Ophiocordyceps polyrhachis-furcata BCC 54312]|uniref:Uncharacterized protein n=1 Tax=Ophiocordyceps polyrhachis-furcata BCC 54312 TaxID=1330021 RepID=A0A367L2U8_9HYPO|nr:hypothetical protein L249_4724 [Ophiocordyceps polyrhachis-furcata BCC 54312]
MIPPQLRTVSSSGPILLKSLDAGPSPRSFEVTSMVDQAAKLPGVRCPKCFAQGVEVWVIPGKNCKECGTPCG